MAGRSYTTEEVERALLAVAIANGNCKLAGRQLKEQYNLSVPASTLRDWCHRTYADRYAQVREGAINEIRDEVVRDAGEMARSSAEVVRQMVEHSRQLASELAGLDPGDKRYKEIQAALEKNGAAARNFATVGGISADKLKLPDQPAVSLSFGDTAETILRRLAPYLQPASADTEGTATAEPSAIEATTTERKDE